jgi:hypothetical protein
MRIFYVIKDILGNKYLSVNEDWNDFMRCQEFDSEESAIKELEGWDGYFIIEKIYQL